MKYYLIIPAHNEADFIALTLESLVSQSVVPSKVVIVNDNSTDNTKKIVESYLTNYSWISLVNISTSDQHLPGTKIINAFNNGLAILDTNYDVICKFDADLIFPSNYLEQLAIHFSDIAGAEWRIAGYSVSANKELSGNEMMICAMNNRLLFIDDTEDLTKIKIVEKPWLNKNYIITGVAFKASYIDSAKIVISN
mgnify:CR=1 FL=1